ncbi:hypothetical protein ACVWZA_003359 [Sphingomonas sp. UYAg733]
MGGISANYLISWWSRGACQDGPEGPIPEMRAGSIVIIDNFPAHKVAGIRECLETAGMHLPYLPALQS